VTDSDAESRMPDAFPSDNPQSPSPEVARHTPLDPRAREAEPRSRNEDLRQAQEALDALQARYVDLYDMAPVGYLSLSEDGLILEANLTAAAVLGVERIALTGQSLGDYVIPDDQAAYRGWRQSLSGAHEPRACELRMLRADATPIWSRLLAAATQSASDPPVSRVVLINITERKRAEEALRASERQYRELVEHANSIILHWSRDGRILFMNEFGLRFFGYTLAEIRGRHVIGTIVPETERGGRDLQPLMDQICADPAAFERNVNENMRHNGERVWIAWTNKVVLDETGEVTEILSIGSDITDQKRAEDEIAEVNEELRASNSIVSALPGVADLQGIMDRVLDGALGVVGLEGGSICLVSPNETLDLAAQKGVSDATIQDLTTNQVKVGECLCGECARTRCPLILRNRAEVLQFSSRESTRGELINFHAAYPLVTGGRCVGILCVFTRTDMKPLVRRLRLLEAVTAQVALAIENARLYGEAQHHAEELEQRVLARTEQLAAKNQELKGFAYTVSHDLKAPLRGIAGYANELDTRHRAGLGERAQFCLAQILTATHNLDHLIEDLLHYSRLDAETPTMTEVDPRRLVETILQDRKLAIAEQGIDVTVDIPFPMMRTWERGLVQVMTNLIDNAIKYSRAAKPPRLSIRAEALDESWRIIVSDNGIGFDMKYHDRIFGLFNRLVRAEDYEGSGAGLAIVKKVLDREGGRIWAVSAVGQGASFYVELPRQDILE
jgi:PAS domain S-box-containing protein